MKITKFPKQLTDAVPVLKTIQKAGYQAYFVGGCVRDTLLGLPLHDVDIASSAYPAEIKTIFKKTVDTGIEHGTVMVLDHGAGYEVTTFRTESTYQDYRRPDHVAFVRSLDEDLKRRDLTINALAMDADGNVIDLFHGLDDLKNHVIRAVGNPQERYHEDALRMMRSLRFMSKLGFTLEKNTEEAIYDNAPLLTKIAVERIHVEWIKLLLGQDPQPAIKAFIKTDLYKYCPHFKCQKEGLLKISQIPNLHLTSETACWTLMGYEFKLQPKRTDYLMRAWKTARELIIETETAQKALMDPAGLTDPHVMFETGEDLLLVANEIARLVGIAQYSDQEIKQAYAQLPIKKIQDIQLTGTDLITELGMKTGPQIGKILAQIKKQILEGHLVNDHEKLITYVQNNFNN